MGSSVPGKQIHDSLSSLANLSLRPPPLVGISTLFIGGILEAKKKKGPAIFVLVQGWRDIQTHAQLFCMQVYHSRYVGRRTTHSITPGCSKHLPQSTTQVPLLCFRHTGHRRIHTVVSHLGRVLQYIAETRAWNWDRPCHDDMPQTAACGRLAACGWHIVTSGRRITRDPVYADDVDTWASLRDCTVRCGVQ